MACESVPLDWSQSQLLLLEENNIHIDNTIKHIIEEEESEDEDESEGDEEGDEDLWETEDEEEEEEMYEDDDEEEIPLSPKRSLANVEGAIPKSILRKLPNSTIRKIIFHAKKSILALETENYLYEKTIDKLEASEREVHFRVPVLGDDELEERLKRARVRVCSSESEEDDPPNDGKYEGVDALGTIHVSQDSLFENMSDNSKGEAISFFKAAGRLAPLNYDVMHHKYGDFVGTAAEKTDFAGEPGVQSRLNSQILISRSQLDEKMKTTTTAVEQSDGKVEGGNAGGRKSASSLAATEEENFDLAVAKKLSITDRLRFASEEEEEFIKRFYEHETRALKDESSIQVHIDAHKHALGILMGIRKDFRMIAKGATGTGMNGKIIADLLVKFRLRMKNQLSVQETRTKISVRKVMTQKKRILDQLKVNKDVGKSVSHIDYDYLLCESSIMETEIDEMNNTLQHLKDLTAQFHRVLQDERQMKAKMQVQEGTMNRELKRRQELIHNFHISFTKYQQQISDASVKMDHIKKRFSETAHVPQPIDYIRQKTEQIELESEVQSLEHKLEELARTMEKTQRKYDGYMKFIPSGTKTIQEENAAWLAGIKAELKKDYEEHKPVRISQHVKLTFADEEEPVPEVEEEDEAWKENDRLAFKVLSAGKVQNRLTMSARLSMRKPEDGQARSMSHISHVLMQPTRFDPKKSIHLKSKSQIYDFDYDLDDQFLDEDYEDQHNKRESVESGRVKIAK